MHYMSVLVLVMLALVVKVENTAGVSRVLVVDIFGSRSHKHFIMAVAEQLARGNHSITYLSGFEATHIKPNIREIYIPNANVFDNLPNLFSTNHVQTFINTIPVMHTYCIRGITSEEFEAAKEEEFDLIILSSLFAECFISIAHKQKIPFIYVTPNVIQGPYSDLYGSPYFTSLGGSSMLGLPYPLTFTQRMMVTLYDHLRMAVTNYYYIPRLDGECRSRNLCPDDMPSLTTMRTQNSLIIANSMPVLETPPLPYAPTVIHAGGIHCRPAKPLPSDLEEWASNSGKAGFIYFSLGSIVKPSDMPEKYRKLLVSVFASLEQQVLWKWDEDTMEGLPPNVHLNKWLPQQDILGHSRLRLFLTHGGLLSLQEATYHGVSILGLPVFVDQKYNVRKAYQDGWGRALLWEDLNYHSLRNNIVELIQDTSMKEEVDRRRRVMRDQPMSVSAWTVYWVEYVLRHRGATHLRCPAVHMPWYKAYNVDVWVTAAVVVVVSCFLVLRFCYNLVRWAYLAGCVYFG